MKITPPPASTTGTPTSPAGGDLSGAYPAPTVHAINGVEITGTPAAGDEVIATSPTAASWQAPPAGGLDSITDGTTTITPVTDLTVPAHSLSGSTPNATLGYVTDTYGGQEAVNTVAATGSTETLPATANVHDLTLTANCTLTLPTLTSGKACAITVILRQDGTGSRLVTWPGSVAWVTGSAPVLKTAASAVDVVTLFTLDGGTTWGGAAVGAGSAVPASTVTDETTLGISPAVGTGTAYARDDHTHGSPSLASIVGGTGAHVHVVGDTFSGDGATTVFYTSNGYQPGTLAAYVAGVRTAITETAPDVVTFGAAPASAANNIMFDYLGDFL